MSFLENPKQYTGSDLETIFFRPILTGPSAERLGIRVLYNMPLPTTVQLWDGGRNILQKYGDKGGWTGGAAATKLQKTIALHRVKAELGFSASDYFSMVYEKIASGAEVNMDDLTGSQLEQAETALFRAAIAENIRATMWVGDSAAATGYNTFDGFLKIIEEFVTAEASPNTTYTQASLDDPAKIVSLFDELWLGADDRLQDLKGEGQLAYFVTSDLYFRYEKYLDSKGADAAYADAVGGRAGLAYHGIPVIDLRLGGYLAGTARKQSFCLLVDRRNLVLAVNTSGFPGTEVRMWYNPDVMQNRQRALFMAGCEVLDESMLAFAYRQ